MCLFHCRDKVLVEAKRSFLLVKDLGKNDAGIKNPGLTYVYDVTIHSLDEVEVKFMLQVADVFQESI